MVLGLLQFENQTLKPPTPRPTYGSFRKLGRPYFGVLIIRILPFRVLDLGSLLLMDKILHYFKDPKLWELRYIPYSGSCRILSINRITGTQSPIPFEPGSLGTSPSFQSDALPAGQLLPRCQRSRSQDLEPQSPKLWGLGISGLGV